MKKTHIFLLLVLISSVFLTSSFTTGNGKSIYQVERPGENERNVNSIPPTDSRCGGYITVVVDQLKVNNYGGAPDYSTCEERAALHGKVFSIDEALKTMPIPAECSRDDVICRCEYLPLR